MGGPARLSPPRRRARRRRPGQEVVRQRRRFHPRREVGRAQALPLHLHWQVHHRRRRPEADEARQEPPDQGPDQDRAVARRDRLPLHLPPPRHQRFQDAESLAQISLLHPPQDRTGLRPHRGEQGGRFRPLRGPHPAPADEGARRVREAERRRRQQQRQQQYSHPYRHNQQQRGSSFHRNFNLPEEVSEAVIDINHGGGLSSSTSSPSRRITMTPYVTQQEQQEGQGGYGGGGANQSARSNDGGTTSSRAAAVSNPYSRNGGGYAQTQRPHQPPVNPYATSNSGDGGGGNGNDNASDDRPMNSLQRQHPHRGGRIRADRRFTTALEIFSGGTEDVDGPDRSAGPPPASVPSSASMQANSERVRKLLENDSDGDDDDDILRPIW
mmetsp:Transcript_31485/g.92331  ORF Transcript_31485/g.92331 Transcript_31485/m.92331 type:complete len:383 (+) Transcript_31485:1030-2178(+)